VNLNTYSKKLKRFYIYKQTATNEMITDFTTEQLINELKKRGCVKFELKQRGCVIEITKPKQYELQADCWAIVKEYAGIYDWTTQWLKLDTIGIDRLHAYYRTSFRRGIRNFHNDIPKARRLILKNIIQRFKTKEVMQDLRLMIEPPLKIKKKKDMSWLNDVKVGQEVYAKVSKMQGEMLGVITKINKYSASFGWYGILRDMRYDKVYHTTPHCIYKCRIPTTTDDLESYTNPWM
jgi:hypothetical protein